MSQEHKSNNIFIRYLGLTAVIIFSVISVLGTGGGGDGDAGDTSVDLLPTYDFNISRGIDSSGDVSNGITVSVPQNGSTAFLRVDPNPVVGTFQCDTVSGECGLATIDSGTFLDVFDETTTLVVGNLRIQILDQVIIGISGLPVIGRIQIESVAAPDGLGAGFITVEMATCTGGAGVNIYQDTVLIGCFTWNDFEQLFDTSTNPAEQLAAFGFQVVEFLFEQVDFVTEILGLIDENATDLQQAGSIEEMCDAFSTAGLTAPTNIIGRTVPDQGMRSLSWIDSNSDSNLGPGDGFVGTLNQCWFNDPTDDVDELLNGVGNFLGYVENIDQNREVITALGFTSVTPPTPGGVFYTDFTISETEETTPGTAEITDVIGLEGGVSIMFTEP